MLFIVNAMLKSLGEEKDGQEIVDRIFRYADTVGDFLVNKSHAIFCQQLPRTIVALSIF